MLRVDAEPVQAQCQSVKPAPVAMLSEGVADVVLLFHGYPSSRGGFF